MRNLFGQLIRHIIVFLLLPLICSCGMEALSFLSSHLNLRSLDSFVIGFICYVLAYGGISLTRGQFYSHFHFLRTVRHELTHSIAAMLAGRRIDEMVVVNPADKDPGETVISFVRYANLSGPSSLISLAPYYLPLFTIPLLPLRFCVFSWIREVIDFLIGFTLAFHYISVMIELLGQKFGLDQPDITKTGVIPSYILIGFFNVLSLATIKAVLHNDWPTGDQLRNALTTSWEWYMLILEKLRRYGLFSGN